MGLDDSGRVEIVFNVLAWKRPSATFLEELIWILVSAGVGIEGVSIFGSTRAILPDGAGPILLVKATGGTPPVGTHNAGAGAYRRPGAQIIARASTWQAANTMVQAAYSALVSVRNEEVSA